LYQYFDPEIETMYPAKLKEWESELIQRQLAYVIQNSPFYQRKFAKTGVIPEKVKELKIYPNCPLLPKKNCAVVEDGRFMLSVPWRMS